MIPNLVALPNYQYFVLPIGVHEASLTQVEEFYAYNDRRKRLFNGFLKGSIDLVAAGCKCVYLDGSFVTSKDQPGDFDACWDPDGVDPSILVHELQFFAPPRLRQKAIYGGEFLPSKFVYGVRTYDFVDFFQRTIDSKGRKGIIKIDLRFDQRLKDKRQ